MNPKGAIGRWLTTLALGAVAATNALRGDLPTAAPLRAALDAAAIVRRDSLFELRAVPWRPTQGIQVVDFQRQLGAGFRGVGYARSEFRTTSTGDVQFGVAGLGRLQIRLDNLVVFEREFREATRPIEYAYDNFRWPAAFTVPLMAGKHTLLFSVTSAAGGGRFFFQAFTGGGKADERVRFNRDDGEPTDWFVTSPRVDDPAVPLSGPWLPVTRPPVQDFAINSSAVFKKHSLVEWHYATGVTYLSLLTAADVSGDAALRDHVMRWAQFTLERLPQFRRQFEDEYAWRGANYRHFRSALLDDTSAPALPMIELLRRGELPGAAPTMDAVLNFVLRQNPRLEDGTFCRDEPEPKTIWADDLFMSTAFLVRAADWKRDPRLWDEVVRQVRGFHRYLANPTTGLYWHGYYAGRREPVRFAWGRANGWFAWAVSDALQFLPADHPGRADLVALQRQHLTALLRLQAPSGLWHQVLDHPESYEETSASAMFLLAMVRGLKASWLDAATFAEPAGRAWAALAQRIDARGVVHGICGGTAIGDSLPYYLQRPQVDHDPRGLGAFITAAVAAAEWSGPATTAREVALP